MIDNDKQTNEPTTQPTESPKPEAPRMPVDRIEKGETPDLERK
ncbi:MULTISPECIES: hypothetical protein [Flavobacterium]|uniref:Uncharacterized protein n=1 Tax=Flavobacterium circumlabens TaxID=2133765 RepID=A0ABY2B1F9_9FLAO|nr:MULTISPECIES: hypothetical protein [Flavobacterium]TCN59624.1 hypothetical protein EV142_102242 [Flavobacterium circumlabens]